VLTPLLTHGSAARAQLEKDLAGVRERLGTAGASARVADIVASLVP
jgi:hypothetical protein